jgi:hypothetical protein
MYDDEMSYKDLPEDFRNSYFKNLIFELYFYFRISKQFSKEEYYINIYKYYTSCGVHRIVHKLRYNTMISSYEISTYDSQPKSTGNKLTRYLHYEDVLTVMWNLEKKPPK